MHANYLPKCFRFTSPALGQLIDRPSVSEVFYHDVGEIFWPQPLRSLKLGHVTGQWSMSPTWVGRVSDPGKNGFHKKYKNLDNIAVYLIASLKSKWKNNK